MPSGRESSPCQHVPSLLSDCRPALRCREGARVFSSRGRCLVYRRPPRLPGQAPPGRLSGVLLRHSRPPPSLCGRSVCCVVCWLRSRAAAGPWTRVYSAGFGRGALFKSFTLRASHGGTRLSMYRLLPRLRLPGGTTPALRLPGRGLYLRPTAFSLSGRAGPPPFTHRRSSCDTRIDIFREPTAIVAVPRLPSQGSDCGISHTAILLDAIDECPRSKVRGSSAQQ